MQYLTIRANALENNLVLWQFVNGKRTSVKWIRNTPTATHQWHTLKIRIAGKKAERYLDEKRSLEYELPELSSGRIGVGSKADSVVYMSDYTVTSKESYCAVGAGRPEFESEELLVGPGSSRLGRGSRA